MSPALAQEKLYTVDDIYSLPDGQRAELVDGQIYYMAPPSRKHQEISGELFGLIREYIKSKNGSCRPYIAPFAVFLDENDRNYVEPDISVICDPDKLNDKGCSGAPDWIIVREYWIVDPDRNRITVYDFESEDTQDYTFSSSVKVSIYEDLIIDFSELAGLLDL